MGIEPGMEGGCQCGAVRYRLLRAPTALYVCHCLHCQKQSSSAFGMSMWVDREGITFSGSDMKIFATRGDSGAAKDCAFCPECGTRIYHAFGGRNTLSVRAGTLDDTSVLHPTSHIWTGRAQPWVAPLLDGDGNCASQPESYDGLLAQWREASTERA